MFLFACESMTMTKHPVQAVPFVYCPPVPNYIVTRETSSLKFSIYTYNEVSLLTQMGDMNDYACSLKIKDMPCLTYPRPPRVAVFG